MASDGNQQPGDYNVDVLLKHPSAIVSRVHLAPGAETPRHAHAHDYVVTPQAATTLVKTTYRGDQVVGTETISHGPNEPYYVAKSEDGTTFSLKNIGGIAMLCDKIQLPAAKGGN